MSIALSKAGETKPAAAQSRHRRNEYQAVHKALRAMMADMLCAVGRTDCHDDSERAEATTAMRNLLEVCRAHLGHENYFIHRAMEARAPGSAVVRNAEHDGHVCEIAWLLQDLDGIYVLTGAVREFAWQQLYRRLSLFVAENFEHMVEEEQANMALLWEHYSDEELNEIHSALVASIPPDEMAVMFRWMIPNLSHGERVGMLSGMRQNMPPEIFYATLQGVRALLSERDWTKLTLALAQ